MLRNQQKTMGPLGVGFWMSLGCKDACDGSGEGPSLMIMKLSVQGAVVVGWGGRTYHRVLYVRP